MRYLAVLLLICGCGPVGIQVNPIKVDVTHTINFGDILLAFKSQCKKELPSDATNQEIDDCAESKLADFINNLGDALGGN